MKVIFCGNMFDDIENDIKMSEKSMPVSSDKFQRGIIRGLIENSIDCSVINIKRVPYFPLYPKVKIKAQPFAIDGVVVGRSIHYTNIRFLNYLSKYFNLKKSIVDDVSGNADDVVLMCFNNSIFTISAMLSVQKKFANVKTCGMIGDLHGAFGAGGDSLNGFLNIIKQKVLSLQDKLTAKMDYFGILTESMAEALGIKGKPYAVIDGIVSGDGGIHGIFEAMDREFFTIFYAGAISEEYGIGHLLNAFALLPGNFRLEIAGIGPAEQLVRERAVRDGRIKYIGFISPEEVEKKQREASVLVSPRRSDESFVAYSFPSKTIECLLSGTPFVAHRLPCYSHEYDGLIQYADDNSDEALAEALLKTCYLCKDQREELGNLARDYIIKEKSPERQIKKIIRLFKNEPKQDKWL